MNTNINPAILDLIRMLLCEQGGTDPGDAVASMVGQRVVVRGDRSGVFFGTLDYEDFAEGKRIVELTLVRRLWAWYGAAECSELARAGVAEPSKCKFTTPTGRIRVLDVNEIHPCTPRAAESLSSVANWTYET